MPALEYMRVSRCSKCQAKLYPEDVVCPKCGSDLELE